MDKNYQALVVRKGEKRTFTYGVETCSVDDLPEGDVLIRVHYSTINFKDCMSCQGHPAITRRFPHTPGIDAAGVVETSTSKLFSEGDRVIVISYAMGMSVPGGFGQYIRVPEAWVMKLDDDMTLEEAMAFGTAGYTAALSVEALEEQHISLKDAKAVVTGATGGLGSVAVALLSAQGCEVTAVTGKPDSEPFLKRIGAAEVVDRSTLEDASGQNMLVPKWDAAIDIAGGSILSTIIKMINDKGVVALTGMVHGTAFEATVLPFILRGIRLVGINAEVTDMTHRRAMWKKLATSWKPENFSEMYTVVGLADLPGAVETVTQGRQVGRIVVDMR